MIGQEEINLVQGLTTFLRECPVIFDCGSNKGDWADIMLKEYGDDCDLFLFEPNDKLLSYTQIKYEYKQNVTFNDFAVSDSDEPKMFYYFENFNNELSSLYKQDWWEKELPMRSAYVNAVRIDTYCDDTFVDYIDYLKLDLEGGEYDALVGCERMLEENKIRIIQIEYGGHYQVSKKTFSDVIKFANHYEYSVYSFTGSNYNKVELASFIEDYHYENYIITKEEIHNYTVGWNREFIENTKDIGKFNFVLEVGTAEGLTAKYICENLLEEDGRMICVDPLNDYYIEGDTEHPYFRQQYQRFLRNTRGLPIELFRDDSRTVLPRFHAFRFALIYIDGNHTEEVVYRDAVNCFPILKVGGYILFDDFHWREETKKGIEKFLTEYNGRYEIIKENYQVLIKKICD